MSEPPPPDHEDEAPPSVYRDPGWVVLSEHQDRLDVAFIEDELARAGIPSTTTRRADDDKIVFRVMVAEADEARAREVLGANVAPPSPASAAGKSQRLVWGLALVPGCAHFYAGATALGGTLLLATLSSVYWSFSDHTVVVAPCILFWIDALGARAVLQGRPAPWLRLLAWVAPLLVAAPGVMMRAAPGVYIGASGRAVCAAADRCGVGHEECADALADQIGYSIRVRRALWECASFLDGRSCTEAYGLREDAMCGSEPFCANAGTPEESACIRVYYGTAGYSASDEQPSADYTYHRGWGM